MAQDQKLFPVDHRLFIKNCYRNRQINEICIIILKEFSKEISTCVIIQICNYVSNDGR